MLGDPPSYSTPRTLALAGVSMLLAVSTLWLAAPDYANYGRWIGLAEMLVAALLLVYGILTAIRFIEARDALMDTRPRTPMYDTPHEWMTFWVGVSLNGVLAVQHLIWVILGQLPILHLLLGSLAGLGIWLCIKTKPRRD